ncbi:cupin domain-containing protein [Streptomyces sp. NPDC059456]|uniref:cupin domain-containing protein n=1 Tax=Streptomyces sp. NPDC059456 TaxID=3346838 RepID=UPI0036BA9057
METTVECVVVRGGGYEGRQGGTFAAGISAQSVGARGLCLHRMSLPGHTRGRPHLHAGHESAILVLSGQVEVWHGAGLADHLVLKAGDYLYIPPDVPHLPVNTQDEEMVAVVARTDPDEQEGVQLLDLPRHLHAALTAVPVASPA